MRRLVRLALLAYPRALRVRYAEEIAEHPASLAMLANLIASGLAERFEGVWRDLRLAVRALARTPGPSLVAMLAIALGVGANVAVYSVVRPVLLEPLPFVEPDRLYDLTILTPGMVGRPTRLQSIAFEPHYLDWRDQAQSFADVQAWRPSAMTRYGDDRAEAVRVTFTTSGMAGMLGLQPLLGRGFTQSDDELDSANVVMLSERYWRNRYGERLDTVGETILLNEEAYQIVGVMPDAIRRLSNADVWLPMRINEAKVRAGGPMMFIRIVGSLAPGATSEQARLELDAIIGAKRESLYLIRMQDPRAEVAPLQEHLLGPFKGTLELLWGAVALVLLIACSNVASVLLVRSLARTGETGVRLALGAGRAPLLRKALSESVLLALAGGAVGVLLAYAGAQVLISALPASFPNADQIAVDVPVLLFALAVGLATGLVAGIAPAWSTLGQNAWETIRRRGAAATSGRAAVRSLGLLTGAQVALAAVLLTGAGLLLHSLVRLTVADSGLNAPEAASIDVSLPRSMPKNSRKAYFRELLARVQASPEVRAAAVSSAVPLRGFSTSDSYVLPDDPPRPADPAESRALNQARVTFQNFVTEDFFDAVGARLKEGRPLESGDGEARNALINETLARRAFPGESALGRSIGFPRSNAEGAAYFTVVGVVADYHQLDARWPVEAELYAHFERPEGYFSAVTARPVNPSKNLVGMLSETAVALNPAAVVRLGATQAETLAAKSGEDRFRAGLVGLFAVIALLLAGSGIFATVAFTVTRRLREIAIRRALGATATGVCRTALGRVLPSCALGTVAGLIAAYWLRSLTDGFLYEIDSLDPTSYGFAVIALVLLAVAACWGPTRRALRLDPARNLRAE